MDLGKKDLAGIATLAGLFFLAAWGCWNIDRELAGPLVAAAGLFLLLAAQFELYRRIQRGMTEKLAEQRVRMETRERKSYEQIESLFSLFSQLKLKAPLPATRGWAASPDLLCTLVQLIREERPQVIVEMGSGVSTLIAACCLRDLGQGKVIALEHQEAAAERCRRELIRHGVEEFGQVRHVGIREVNLLGQWIPWYMHDQLRDLPAIDMLIVDGQPRPGAMARYPAVPLLAGRLSDDAIILLDDGDRADETKIAQLWVDQLTGFEAEYLPLEKGAFVFRKQRCSKSRLRIAG